MEWLIAAYILGAGLTLGLIAWSLPRESRIVHGWRMICAIAFWPILWVAIIVLALLPKPAPKD